MATNLIAMVITGHGTAGERKVLSSEDDIFYLPDNLATSEEYSPGAVLDDNEWFGLADFSTKPYCLNLLQQESFSSVNYDLIATGDFGKILFLCGYQDEHYFFQRITPARQIRQKRVYFGEQCKYEKDSKSITLNDYADAIYSRSENRLYFRKLSTIIAIFNGIDEIYREATEEEVKIFLGYRFIELSHGFTSGNVKTNNRKRIALALETLRRFTEDERKTVFEYIKDYCPELANSNNKFIVHNEDSLKRLLYGIEQRYYTTPVGEERRLANSIITLS